MEGTGTRTESQHRFAAAPRAVTQRKKYREPSSPNGVLPSNVMWDKRIVRGSTYASAVPSQPDGAQLAAERAAQRRRLNRAKRATASARGSTPDPVMGRAHMDVQTDGYLEEILDRTLEYEAETQTEFALDRPVSPLFLPAKIGVDVATEIPHGDLFDFDREVAPVLEVLVGKTLEQAMMEVLEEEELALIRAHQEEFERIRNAELLQVQRMVATEKRRADEMERRKAQIAAAKEKEKIAYRKVTARMFARNHLAGLKEAVLDQLQTAGLFQDMTETSVETYFLPWLLKEVCSQISTDSDVHTNIVNDILRESVTTGAHGLPA